MDLPRHGHELGMCGKSRRQVSSADPPLGRMFWGRPSLGDSWPNRISFAVIPGDPLTFQKNGSKDRLCWNPLPFVTSLHLCPRDPCAIPLGDLTEAGDPWPPQGGCDPSKPLKGSCPAVCWSSLARGGWWVMLPCVPPEALETWPVPPTRPAQELQGGG